MFSKKKLYLQLSFEDLYSLLDSHKLNVSDEYLVLQAVLNWVEYKPDQHVPDTCNTIESQKKLKTEKVHNTTTQVVQEHCLDDKSTMVTDKIVFSKAISNCLNKSDTEACQNKGKKISQSMSTNSAAENDRLYRFEVLLRRVRTSIISPTLLMNVLQHNSIKHNEKAKEIIVSAILNQTIYFKHGQWPKTGIYRESHEYGNYGICSLYRNGTFESLSYGETWNKMKSCPSLAHNVQLVAFENEIYAAGCQSATQTKSKLFVYANKWKEIVELPAKELYLASNENHIYITSVTENVIYRFDPKYADVNLIKFTEVPKGSVVTHVMSYRGYLLIFCTETVNGVQETAVHMLDLPAKSWTRLDNLNGPAKNIISFRNDDNHFVLQTNGNLWALNQSDGMFTFTLVKKLWALDHVLYGAVVFGEKLVIFYYKPDETKDSKACKVDNMFSQIKYWYTDEPCSSFIPAVLPKSYAKI
ncbi:uncharacterized protein LOC131955135 [Physella acuta]|uniref:uncharacterized protein LOC131955135 n=1 Tax=Physella acuta TaxID=109671 RepID=UPI0027DCD9AE|nr:uncharacterized protein LOC131955135 [Physella acuta]